MKIDVEAQLLRVGLLVLLCHQALSLGDVFNCLAHSADVFLGRILAHWFSCVCFYCDEIQTFFCFQKILVYHYSIDISFSLQNSAKKPYLIVRVIGQSSFTFSRVIKPEHSFWEIFQIFPLVLHSSSHRLQIPAL